MTLGRCAQWKSRKVQLLAERTNVFSPATWLASPDWRGQMEASLLAAWAALVDPCPDPWHNYNIVHQDWYHAQHAHIFKVNPCSEGGLFSYLWSSHWIAKISTNAAIKVVTWTAAGGAGFEVAASFLLIVWPSPIWYCCCYWLLLFVIVFIIVIVWPCRGQTTPTVSNTKYQTLHWDWLK